MKKRLTSFILLLAIVIFLFTTEVNAAQQPLTLTSKATVEEILQKDFGEMLYLFNLDCEEPLDCDSIVLLNPVDFLIVNQENKNSDIIINIPVMDNSNAIRCIYSIIYSSDGYSTSIGTDFAPLLNEATMRDRDGIVLLQNDSGLYMISESRIFFQNGNKVESLNTDENNILMASIKKNIVPSNTVSLEVNQSYTQIALKSVAEYKNDSCFQYAESVGVNSEVIDIGDYNSWILSPYPIVDQRVNGAQKGLCWAAVVASIVRFEKRSSTLTAKQVADYMKIDYNKGANSNEIRTALEHYLGSGFNPTKYSRVLSPEEIRKTIINNHPAAMCCDHRSGFLGLSLTSHAVALMGYYFTSQSFRVRIMDPAYETFKWCSLANGSWTFAFGNYSFTWKRTVTIK